jgi:hypothetical protein
VPDPNAALIAEKHQVDQTDLRLSLIDLLDLANDELEGRSGAKSTRVPAEIHVVSALAAPNQSGIGGGDELSSDKAQHRTDGVPMHGNASALGKALAAIAAVAGLLAVQTAAAPLSQAATGPTRVTKVSPADSTTLKQVAAVCPAGKRVVGGGSEIVNGRGQVVLQQLQPRRTATDERFVAGAREDANGYGRAWRLRVFAVCADPLPGQQIIASTAAVSSDPQQSLVGLCPNGQREIGFGGRINNGAGQVRLTDLYDFFGPPSSLLIVGAREERDGYAGRWSLSSYTICANEAAASDFVLVAAPSPTDSMSKSATVTCPAGTGVHTAGAQLRADGIGQATTASLVIDKVGIDPALTSVTVRAVEDQGGTNAHWSVVAFALCGPPGPGGP